MRLVGLCIFVCLFSSLSSGGHANKYAKKDIGKFLSDNRNMFPLLKSTVTLDDFDKKEGKHFNCPWDSLKSPDSNASYVTSECFALYRFVSGGKEIYVFKTTDEVTPYLFKLASVTKGKVSEDFTLAFEYNDPEGDVSYEPSFLHRVRAKILKECDNFTILQSFERGSGKTFEIVSFNGRKIDTKPINSKDLIKYKF